MIRYPFCYWTAHSSSAEEKSLHSVGNRLLARVLTDQQWKRRGLNAPWSNKENEIRVIFTGSVVSSLFFEN